MKKIVFYIKGIYNGGTEIALLNLISALDKSLYDIYIVNEDYENYNETIVEKMKNYAKIIELQEIETDALIYCTAPNKDISEIMSKIKYKKAFFWFHYFSNSQLNFLEKVNLEKLVDNVIVVCETIKKRILNLEMYKNFSKNVISIYNILPVENIFEKSKEEIDLELSDNLNLITVGRLCKEKGFYRMKHLMDMFAKNNIDFKWHVLGCASNEADENEIRQLMSHYPENVIMHGYQENPYKYIPKCDYLVLLSDEENMPFVVVEAKVLGVPCILTDFDSAYEQIDDMKNGIILSREDLATYENRVNDILKNKEMFKEEVKKYKYSNEESLDKWNEILN